MSTAAAKPTRSFTPEEYERAAQEYADRLTIEEIMESTPQATQRAITMASLSLLRLKRPDVRVFNELLVQYPIGDRIGQICPDNMIARDDQPEVERSSFNVANESARLMVAMEYVSKHGRRKDNEVNFHKYEDELRIPYLLIFDPERQELRVFRHRGDRFESIKADKKGLYAVAELDLHVGLMERWVRFWHNNELLELPDELQGRLDELEKELRQERRLREQAEAEVQRLQDLLNERGGKS